MQMFCSRYYESKTGGSNPLDVEEEESLAGSLLEREEGYVSESVFTIDLILPVLLKTEIQ